MSFADYLIIALVLLGMIFAVVHMIKSKRDGKCAGCGNCEYCEHKCDKGH